MPDDFLSLSIPCTATILLGMLSEPATAGAPRLESLEPPEAVPGVVIAGSGSGLAGVSGVLVSDGRLDLRATIVEQTESVLKFSIPQAIRPGRQRIRLICNTSGRPQIVDQQLVLLVNAAVE